MDLVLKTSWFEGEKQEQKSFPDQEKQNDLRFQSSVVNTSSLTPLPLYELEGKQILSWASQRSQQGLFPDS